MTHLSWLSIFRLGLVQMALGAIVVLTTSTLNRLMIVEMALPAVLPGALVALHYGIQISRPKWGFISDVGGKRTRWIIAGMGILALGGLIATWAVTLFGTSYPLALGLSILAFALIGLGVGASGTSLLALLATGTAPSRRAAAATTTWLMMIAGIAITAGVVGALLDPYSHARLLQIVAIVVALAFVLTIFAIWGIERRTRIARSPSDGTPFLQGLAQIWREDKTRHFTIFVFLSMTAYFMQELILEPYAGLVFAYTPGQSTSLSGAQNGGVFLGMLLVGIAASGFRIGHLGTWVMAGCLCSAAALVAIAALGQLGAGAPLRAAVVALGFFNGVFAVAAIGTMMQLAGEGAAQREGTRMGIWGAAQAIAAGFGGLTGAVLVDVMRRLMGSDAAAFGSVFIFEAVLFVIAAIIAWAVIGARQAPRHGRAQVIPGE